ncbi:hypothetical protein IQ250_10730 [Pseudanabaenaceae cyanobacterium LEGE 13415]|nr:hypothetical protein [Pseudanabaenaceae cyanobacterium LEGE 13415]
MKRRTWAGNTLVVSTVLVSGFAVSAKLLSSTPPEGQISSDVEDLYQDLLEQAQTDAQHDRLSEAMVAITSIPSNSRHHIAAQQLREQWSKDLLRFAQNAYSKGQPREAIELLKAIPPSTSTSVQAKSLQTNWGRQLQRLEQAEIAYSNSNWGQALRFLESLKNTALYTSPRVQEMLQQSIAAAFHPGDAATEISMTDKIIPAQLTAAAPSPLQPEAESAPELSPIAMDVDLALQRSNTPPIPTAHPTAHPTAQLSLPPAQPSLQSSPPVSSDSIQPSAQPSLPSLPAATANTASNPPAVDRENAESRLNLSTQTVIPVLANPVPTIEVTDFSATTEAIDSIGTEVQAVPSSVKPVCSPTPEPSSATPEFSSAMRLRQKSLKSHRIRDRGQNLLASAAQLASCKP